MHHLLVRQLRKLGLAAESPPNSVASWREFLGRIGKTYEQADQDRYLLERSLALASKEMQGEISVRKEREGELRIAKEQAEEANRAKSLFLANMSHEIRTPMNGIIGLTEIVLGSSLEQEQRENLELVRTSALSLLEIINDILDLSRIEAGKMTFESIPFDLQSCVETALRPLSLRAETKGLRMEWEVEPEIPRTLVGDPCRLRQLLTNLAGNAIKFTERGRIDVLVMLDSSRSDGIILRFQVRDTGIGIPRGKQEAIFDAFEQIDASITRKFGGTGLGLTICREIVKLMGGTISVESEPGKGSTFTFTSLFAVEKEALSTPPSCSDLRPPSPAKSCRSLRILIAEDNPVNQRVVATMLRKRGHEVAIVDDGQKAAAAVEASPFDVVLMDVQMPVMGGYDATTLIRKFEEKGGRRVSIIALTAHALKGDRERCIEAGMDDYVTKPIQTQELFEAIDRVMGRAKDPVTSSAPGA